MSGGRILFIDAYDSFSNNIINLLHDRLSVTVDSVFIDDPRFVFNDDAFHEHLQQFDAVVAGPGPGHPSNPNDIGLIAKLWTLSDSNLLPVLGICLGFQSLCLAHGASVGRLTQPRHGLVTPITHCGEDVYAQTGDVRATQYHSLHVNTGSRTNAEHTGEHRWMPTEACKELIPLAWDLSDPENGPIFIAAKHSSKPFRGVQYHPESICTNDEGQKLVDNWWREACTWNATPRATRAGKPSTNGTSHRANSTPQMPYKHNCLDSIVHWTSFKPSAPVDAASVVQMVRNQPDSLEPLLLESGTRDNGDPVNPETGRFSIIGLQDAASTNVRYSSSTHLLQIVDGDDVAIRKCKDSSEVFEILESLVQARRASGGSSGSPFWGGFVGFVSYEAGLETINVTPPKPSQDRPDVWFIFVEQSIIIDHIQGTVYVQSLRKDDVSWLADTKAGICGMQSGSPKPVKSHLNKPHAQVLSGPERNEYCDKVRTCQSHLRAGSSYELCLTDCTHIRSDEDSWSLYLRLRAANPAPFSAYFDLTSSTNPSMNTKVVGSSPERFLSWSRDGACQFRPIKGTVKKTPTTTRAMAEAQLNTPKEQAENLMIVDLIRHDLSGVPGVQNVHVPQLMTVEEYATVYQLVSVISGTLTPSTSGIPVLAASLPPGSMTGAPKKRSCAILTEIEAQKPRGLYSGVLGYLDVGGGGDFSVVIRTAFQYGGGGDWQIGAGGAVTVLSDAQAEWEEMATKRESLLKVLGLEEVGGGAGGC
ncbi:hypothetical protein Q7P37_011059 [Cladosporium fusiforme]